MSNINVVLKLNGSYKFNTVKVLEHVLDPDVNVIVNKPVTPGFPNNVDKVIKDDETVSVDEYSGSVPGVDVVADNDNVVLSVLVSTTLIAVTVTPAGLLIVIVLFIIKLYLQLVI